MGKVFDWQKELELELASYEVTIYNPRRDDWDSTWVQEATNPQFHYQVNWELDMLKRADIIFMFFSHETKSPISLLELGIIKDQDVIVCCPKGFWRKGNVDIVCNRHMIPVFTEFDSAVSALKSRIRELQS